MFQKLDASKRFDTFFDSVRVVVHFNPDWAVGDTGEFYGAVNSAAAIKLNAGAVIGSIAPDGRKLIIMGSPYGNVVIFQRTVKTSDAPVEIAVNLSSFFNRAVGEPVMSPLSMADLDFLLVPQDVLPTDQFDGDLTRNMGYFLQTALEHGSDNEVNRRFRQAHKDYLAMQAVVA